MVLISLGNNKKAAQRQHWLPIWLTCHNDLTFHISIFLSCSILFLSATHFLLVVGIPFGNHGVRKKTGVVLCNNLVKVLVAIELNQRKRQIQTDGQFFSSKMSFIKIETKLILVRQF